MALGLDLYLLKFTQLTNDLTPIVLPNDPVLAEDLEAVVVPKQQGLGVSNQSH